MNNVVYFSIAISIDDLHYDFRYCIALSSIFPLFFLPPLCLKIYIKMSHFWYIFSNTVYARWGKNPHFIQKFTYWKSQFLQNSPFWNPIFHKIHVSKISIFTKFTFLKSQFSQNSHFWNLIFHKIHISLDFRLQKSCKNLH